MNVYDSERMMDLMTAQGYDAVNEPGDADLILLNTCHIREKAAEKVYSDLGRIKQIKTERANQNKPTMVGVTGCVAQAEADEIIKRQPIVDLVVGPQTYHNLPELVTKAKTEKVLATEFPVEDKFEKITKIKRRANLTAFVTVQEGCDKFCTFCVVPYTRGMETSRPVEQIVDEITGLVDQGVKEVTLLGQNVNAYRGAPPAELRSSPEQEWGLGQLINHLTEVSGLERIRYTTSHPRDMSQDLIEAHKYNAKLMPYLHLPLQSGSDRILKAMNRQHTAEEYLTIIDQVRAAQPDIALSSDFIVGFPGETDDDFSQTLLMIERVGYSQAFSFKYSPRPGTPGADLDDQVDEDVKSQRLSELQALLTSQQRKFNQDCVGKFMNVLLEKPGRHPGQLIGRSPYLQPVHVDCSKIKPGKEMDLLGLMVSVQVTGIEPNSLSAKIEKIYESNANRQTELADIAPTHAPGVNQDTLSLS